MWVGPKKIFEPELNPKYSPLGPKKGKKGPQMAPNWKQKKGLYLLIWSCYSTGLGPKTVFKHDLSQTTCPAGSKKVKRVPKLGWFEKWKYGFTSKAKWVESKNSSFDFKFQFKVLILSFKFNFKFQFQVLISSFNFKF